jgi:hypothetical protein
MPAIIERRELIAALAGVAAWPLAARAAVGADAADHLTPHLHPQQTAAIKAN